MQVMKEETFGPVIAVMAVEDQEEAIRYANESHYGLNASVWSRDLSLARSVAMRLRTGGVCINDVVLNYGIVDAPFSGVKDSGLGQRHGTRGLLNYTEEQVITEDRLGLRTEMNWYPYSDGRLRRLKSVLGLLGGAWTRLKGARKP
jgi:acyl-CoA reductase-like NAD-dependent aldehyde dehydrogenase